MICLLNDGQFTLEIGCLFKCNMKNYSDDLGCQYAKTISLAWTNEVFGFMVRGACQ